MIRRLLRAIAALGLLGGLGFALAKVLQGRRSGQATMSSGEEPVVPKRSETPLVDPKMLHNVNLKPPGAEVSDDDDEAGPGAPPRRNEPVIRRQAPQAIKSVARTVPAEPKAAPADATSEAVSVAGAADEAPAGPKTWIDPDGNICPTSHPVKAKLASKIFHLPGMTAYERTTPDRCYPDEASAEADGLRKAKR